MHNAAGRGQRGALRIRAFLRARSNFPKKDSQCQEF